MPERHIWVLLYMVFLLVIVSNQKGIEHDEESSEAAIETSNDKWDEIFKDPGLKIFEESNNSNDLNSFGKESSKKNTKSNSRFSGNEDQNLSEDEVFIHEQEGPNSVLKNKKESATSIQIALDPKFILSTTTEIPLKPQQVISEDSNVQTTEENAEVKQQSEPNSKFDNSLVDIDRHTDVLNMRSFIFNPNAKPQEKFQNCTTPKNESGTCRYLQHCLIPTIVSSLSQFMGYVCIIEEQFIGVCCPNFPVSVLTLKSEKEPTNIETNSNQECGIGKNRRIVGGLNADPKAWPWMVALFTKFGKSFYCGGVLINDRYVLTAAHCTLNIFMNEIIARLGEYDFKNDGESHIEYAVTEIKRHGHFNRRSLRNDIALLKLEKPVVFNDFIETICLPEEEKDYVGDQATLVGWGNIAGGSTTSNVLQEASLHVISNSVCSRGHGLPIPPFLICTSSESQDKGACNGDSGGPLMLLDSNNRWKVIGLVSWGRRGCNPEYPTVYTRVSHYLEWIKKHST